MFRWSCSADHVHANQVERNKNHSWYKATFIDKTIILKKDPSNKERNTMASTSADVPMEDATAAPAPVSRNCVFVEGAKDWTLGVLSWFHDGCQHGRLWVTRFSYCIPYDSLCTNICYYRLINLSNSIKQNQAKAAPKCSLNPPRFEIKKWNAVAMWSWDICADTVSEFYQ